LSQCPAITAIARRHQAAHVTCLAAAEPDAGRALVVLHPPNDRVEELVAALDALPDLAITLVPQSVLTLGPAGNSPPDRVTEVKPLSPLEVYLAGLQSVGSWRGFLAYAAAAGALAWVGLYTDTIYLLVAAMLVAPFASPAMNLAIATARGDGRLMARSLARYAAGLAMAAGVAGLLSLLTGQSATTALMVASANLSDVALLLPLVAGAAGALSQVQASRASLVSGAAVGLLVAASLAPPAALIGMAAALREWPMATVGLFQLTLQLVGINLAGSAVFWAFGLRPRGSRHARGCRRVAALSALGSAVALAGLLAWQFSSDVPQRQDSAAQRATAIVESLVADSGMATVIDVRARYPRPATGDGRVLLCEVVVVSREGRDPEAVKRRLTADIQDRLRERGLARTVLVDVTVLKARASSAAPSGLGFSAGQPGC
jgi:uncharacterized hydrophobic protein (TIGR00271 family)